MIKAFSSLCSIFLGISISLLVVKLLGESPFQVLKILVQSNFTSHFDMGMTLFYAVPLMLTGLSVSLAYRVGLFNIGAEGQLLWGALGAVLPGILLPHLTPTLAILLSFFSAFLFGAFWAWIPAILKEKRGSHEVITTLLLNFIASAFISYVLLYWIKDPESQNIESLPIPSLWLLPKIDFFEGAPVTGALLFVLLLLGLDFFFNRFTRWGLEMKACGANEVAASVAGLSTSKIKIGTMCVDGGIAGLVGAIEVLGHEGRFRFEFSPGYGFMGIAVAMMAQNHPLGIFFSALFLAALHKGSLDLNIETAHITKELAQWMEAIIILFASAPLLFEKLFHQKKKGLS